MKTTRVRRMLVGLILILNVMNAFAVSANSNVQNFTQPNGTSFQGRLIGDEYFHWTETPAGEVFMLNKKSGFYEYVVLEQGKEKNVLHPSGIAVGSAAAPALVAIPGVSTRFILNALWKEARKNIEAQQPGQSMRPVPAATGCRFSKVFYEQVVKAYVVEGSFDNPDQAPARVEVSDNRSDWYRAVTFAGDFQAHLPNQQPAKGNHVLYGRTWGKDGVAVSCGPFSYTISDN